MITNPSAVRFCNERVRPLADAVARVYAQLSSFRAEFTAKELAQYISDDANEVVSDGSDVDGRTPITGHDVNEMLVLADDMISFAAGASSKLATVIKVAVNPR